MKIQAAQEEDSAFNEDSDGDLQVRRENFQSDLFLEIEHKLETNLANVGYQIWRGSLLMADYVIQVRKKVLKHKDG